MYVIYYGKYVAVLITYFSLNVLLIAGRIFLVRTVGCSDAGIIFPTSITIIRWDVFVAIVVN